MFYIFIAGLCPSFISQFTIGCTFLSYKKRFVFTLATECKSFYRPLLPISNEQKLVFRSYFFDSLSFLFFFSILMRLKVFLAVQRVLYQLCLVCLLFGGFFHFIFFIIIFVFIMVFLFFDLSSSALISLFLVFLIFPACFC